MLVFTFSKIGPLEQNVREKVDGLDIVLEVINNHVMIYGPQNNVIGAWAVYIVHSIVMCYNY